jgi:hypothetical protein
MQAAGALTALSAEAQIDSFVWGTDNAFLPSIHTHTPFVISQRSIPLVSLSGYLGKVVRLELFPNDCADLLTNMYLQFSLPPGDYVESVGRGIIDKMEFFVGSTLIETVNDDWYIIRDELFLDADQQTGIKKVVGSTTGGDYLVPLEFFFCQKNKHFPMCSIESDHLSFIFYFNKPSWITSSIVDIMNVNVIIEEITLSTSERLLFKTTSHVYDIPTVQKEGTLEYVNGVARLHMSADFPVTMMVWFVRNKLYEQDVSKYYKYRYSYGYTTKYINNTIPVKNFDGSTNNYIDVSENIELRLNNYNILQNFPDGLYHTVKQPLDHNLTMPVKSMYMYCFTEEPKKYQKDGAMNFKLLPYSTTYLALSFLPEYAPDILANYSINLYYYGYKKLTIQGGVCVLR